MNSTRLIADPVHSLAAGSMSAAYMGIGPVFDHSGRMVLVNNLTDDILTFSYDGVNDHFILPVYTSLLLTIDWNKDSVDDYLAIPKGSRLYVKHSSYTPTVGSVYVTYFRAVDDA